MSGPNTNNDEFSGKQEALIFLSKLKKKIDSLFQVKFINHDGTEGNSTTASHVEFSVGEFEPFRVCIRPVKSIEFQNNRYAPDASGHVKLPTIDISSIFSCQFIGLDGAVVSTFAEAAFVQFTVMGKAPFRICLKPVKEINFQGQDITPDASGKITLPEIVFPEFPTIPVVVNGDGDPYPTDDNGNQVITEHPEFPDIPVVVNENGVAYPVDADGNQVIPSNVEVSCSTNGDLQFKDPNDNSLIKIVSTTRNQRAFTVPTENIDANTPVGVWAGSESCVILNLPDCPVRIFSLIESSFQVGELSPGSILTLPRISYDGGATYIAVASSGSDTTGTYSDIITEKTFTDVIESPLLSGAVTVCTDIFIAANNITATGRINRTSQTSEHRYNEMRCCNA